jgi:hypothetical protein
MERTLISWNLPNWITIFLMAAGGYAAFGLGRQVLMRGLNRGGG